VDQTRFEAAVEPVTVPADADSPLSAFDGYIQGQIDPGTVSRYADSVVCLERILLSRVLDHNGGKQSRAAQRLGITRGSLRNKL
jgi:two-component system nitrogen regulation response regulator GlnG